MENLYRRCNNVLQVGLGQSFGLNINRRDTEGRATVAELELKVGDERIFVRVELVFASDHRGHEFFDLLGGRSGEGAEFGLRFLNLGGAFDGGVPNQNGDIHCTLSGGAVIAGLLKDGLTKG